MTQIFAASTLYGAMTVAAAIDAGQFGPPGRERILLVCNNVDIPEVATPLHRMHGAQSVVSRFSRIVYWNELIAPYHPSMWGPRGEDLVLWRSIMAQKIGIPAGPLELIVESIQVKPAQTLVQIFSDAIVTVYADGVMTYGPTRNDLHRDIHARTSRVLYLDLIPRLVPMLLTEYRIPSQPVDTRAVLGLMAELTRECRPLLDAAIPPHMLQRGQDTAVLLGQYLSALNILTEEEEEQLHLRMFEAAVGMGFRSVIFKPHPSAPSNLADTLTLAAHQAGVDFLVLDAPVLAETIFEYLKPRFVIGCFSTGLFTARSLYGIGVGQIGALEVIRRMRPYENSNRIPVTITHALLPDLEAPNSGMDRIGDAAYVTGELSSYVSTVGFCMQPKRYAFLRPIAEQYIASCVPVWNDRPELAMHFNDKTRDKLELPGPPTKKMRAGRRMRSVPSQGMQFEVPVNEVSLESFASLLEDGDDEGALEVGTKLLAEREHFDVLIGMAQLRIRTGEMDVAEEHLQKAVRQATGSDRALTWLRIGETAARMGKRGADLRQQAGREALRINPNSPAAERLVKGKRFGRR
ncbi:polysialyltransferase family glycosyltransferase [Streptomyces sp. NPDC048603]|uniref:polysialyltransferase family glycosyltransferase n=1 Tax=Streptomyces sp. NPDC048603 TaxID=3365577 RepID=UPI003717BB8B